MTPGWGNGASQQGQVVYVPVPQQGPPSYSNQQYSSNPTFSGPLYQDTQATLSNTIREAGCQSTGVFCSNHEVCCTKACKLAKGRESRVCCLTEGSICDSSQRGNPGISQCCAGLQCMPMPGGDKKVCICQVPLPKGG